MLSLRTLVLNDDDKPLSDIMYDEVLAVTPDVTEEEVAADIFKYDVPAMPVVDEAGEMVGIVTVDDAWDAIEDDVQGDRKRMGGLKVAGIVAAAVLGLALYTIVLLHLVSVAGFAGITG